MNATICFTVPMERAEELIALITSIRGHGYKPDASVELDRPTSGQEPIQFSASEARLREFAALTVQLRRLVEFVVKSEGEFRNDELAAELGLESPAATSTFLAKITQRLRRAGIEANRSEGNNWYTKRRVSDTTVLCVRPDVLEFFKEALHTESW
jgi:hypothetical protein